MKRNLIYAVILIGLALLLPLQMGSNAPAKATSRSQVIGDFVYPTWWAGGQYSGQPQQARTVYATIQVPNSMPPSDGPVIGILLSVFDSNGSYDQLGFSGGGNPRTGWLNWGIVYSFTSGPDDYHTVRITSFNLSLGLAYTFEINAFNNSTYFNVYQGPERGSNLIWTANNYTAAYCLDFGVFYNDYTVYEEIHPDLNSLGIPNTNFYFYNNYWLQLDSGAAHATTLIPSLCYAPSNVTAVVGGNAVLVNNLGIISPQYPPTSAMKTRTDGYFYLPNRAAVFFIKIEALFDNAKLVGDQAGGISPYPSIPNWPDGNVSLVDLVVVSNAYGSNEGYVSGPKPWNYMADIVPNRIIDLSDLAALSGNYGYSGGTYTTNLTGVTVSFDNGTPTQVPFNGFLAVPGPLSNATVPTNFTTSLNGNPIGALVTFWAP